MEAATAAVAAAMTRAVAAVAMVAAEGGGGDPSLNSNPPQPLPTITTTMVVTLQQGWRFGLGEPACPAGPPPRGLRRVFDDPPRGDPPPAWAHARAQIAVGMGWAGAGLSHAKREAHGHRWATGSATWPSRWHLATQTGGAGQLAVARALSAHGGRSVPCSLFPSWSAHSRRARMVGWVRKEKCQALQGWDGGGWFLCGRVAHARRSAYWMLGSRKQWFAGTMCA